MTLSRDDINSCIYNNNKKSARIPRHMVFTRPAKCDGALIAEGWSKFGRSSCGEEKITLLGLQMLYRVDGRTMAVKYEENS